MASALEGIVVLDVTEGMAGALATMLLCDYGARVIRLASSTGDARRREPGYEMWDRGKENIGLDSSQYPGLFDRLIERSDVLFESFSAGSSAQALVNYPRLRSINPRLVHCSITAYGNEGGLRHQPPMDDLVMARVGILANQPSFRAGPVHVIHPLPSIGAGLLAALGVVASLYWREGNGRGRTVETSLMTGALLYAPKIRGERLTPSPPQAVPAGGAPFYSVYRCADDNWIQLGCIHSGFVDLAAAVLGIAEVLVDPKYGDGRRPTSEEARQELFDLVSDAMKTRPYEEWAKLFEEADVPYARASTAEDAMSNPQVRSTALIEEVVDPKLGIVSQMGPPVRMSDTPGKIRGPRMATIPYTDSLLSSLPIISHQEPQASVSDDASALTPPLTGVEVLEITNVIAGPTAGKLLADLGARTIKLESLDGDISRPTGSEFFYYLNSNKRSASVNTRTPEGKEIARRLTARADVLLTNMRPGATDRMGIGPDELQKMNPGLIETHVTAFGRDGPYAHRPGLDPLAQALIGLQRAQGGPENPPVFLSRLAPTDFSAGALGALGSVMALYVRERTGVAQRVDTNLLIGGMLVSGEGFVRYRGRPPRRLADKGQYGLDPLHRLYETKDGWIYLVAENEKTWLALCAILGLEDLAVDSRFASMEMRRANTAALSDEIGRAFSKRPAHVWIGLLEAADIACAPVVEEYRQGFFSDAHARDNDMIARHEHPTLGRLELLRNSVRFLDTADVEARPPPLLGEHTTEVLAEAGYSSEHIESLYRSGVVKTEEAQ